MGERCGRSACMAVILTEDVPDSCPSGTLTGTCFGWPACTAVSLTEGTCFLTPEGGSPRENTESSSSTTAGAWFVRPFRSAVVLRGRVSSTSLRNASRAAADTIRITRKKIKLSQNRKLSRADLILCACGLARYSLFCS